MNLIKVLWTALAFDISPLLIECLQKIKINEHLDI